VATKEDTNNKELVLVTMGDQVKVKMLYGYAWRIFDPVQFLKIDSKDAFTIIDSKLQMTIEEVFSNPLRPLYAIKLDEVPASSANNVLNMLDEIRDMVGRDLTDNKKGYGGIRNNGWIRFNEYGVEIAKINISGGQLIDEGLVKEIAAIMKEELQRRGQRIETEVITATIKSLIAEGMPASLAGQLALVMAGKAKVSDIKWIGLLEKATGLDAWLLGEEQKPGVNLNPNPKPKK
jgi:hypothetical protein